MTFTRTSSEKYVYTKLKDTGYLSEFLRPLFKESKKASVCVSKWNRTMQYYLYETYKPDLPKSYKTNANISFNVLARVNKITNERQMDCEVGTWAYNY